MPERRHYQTEDEAVQDLWRIYDEAGGPNEDGDGYGWTVYHFVAGILTIAVPYGFKTDEPRVLLNENGGLYWEVPDA